jgi:hypothetical protein
MSQKHLISIALILLGLYLIINGSNALHQSHLSPATFWKKTENFFTNNPMWNPIIKFFGGTPIAQTSSPRKGPAIIALVTGSILLLGGILHLISLGRRK